MKLPSGIEVYPSTMLTRNFTWGEATHNCTRCPLSISIENNIINSAIQLQKIRDHFDKPIIVTSWYRDPASNKAAGGAQYSEHLRGLAIDFKIVGMKPYNIYQRLQHHPGGLGWYRGGWVHIDWRNWESKGAARWQG